MLNHRIDKLKILLLFSILFFFASLCLFAEENENSTSEQSEEPQEVEDVQKVDIRVSEVRARINPQFELVLPSGNISEHFVIYFNRLEMTFDLGFSIIDSSVDGQITFAYPIKKYRPYISFFQKVDFENLISPQLSDGEFSLLPTDKYVSRKRGSMLGVRYQLYPKISIEPSFIINDTFKGSFTENKIVEDGVDLIPRISFIYDNVRAELPDNELFFTGMYYRSIFSILYRDRFDNPVSADNQNLFLLHHNLDNTWFFTEKASLDYPIKVWQGDIANFYSLGGVDTIRGYEYNSLSAFRFFLLSTDVERDIFKERELKFKVQKLEARLHQYRILILWDILSTQDKLKLGSHVSIYSSVGAGLSFVLSGKSKTHFKIRLYAAQALGESFAPIIYFRTSLFGFEKKI